MTDRKPWDVARGEVTEVVPAQVPAWLGEMEFCHIDDGSDERAYCGETKFEGLCAWEYNGEAICLGCGYPTCPRCAQLSDLDVRAESSLSELSDG